MRLRLLSRRTQANAKAVAAEVERRIQSATPCRPTTLGALNPTAATQNTLLSEGWSSWIHRISTNVFPVPVVTPFHEIAVHIVQAETVREFLSDAIIIFLTTSLTILAEPTVLLHLTGFPHRLSGMFNSVLQDGQLAGIVNTRDM